MIVDEVWVGWGDLQKSRNNPVFRFSFFVFDLHLMHVRMEVSYGQTVNEVYTQVDNAACTSSKKWIKHIAHSFQLLEESERRSRSTITSVEVKFCP